MGRWAQRMNFERRTGSSPMGNSVAAPARTAELGFLIGTVGISTIFTTCRRSASVTVELRIPRWQCRSENELLWNNCSRSLRLWRTVRLGCQSRAKRGPLVWGIGVQMTP